MLTFPCPHCRQQLTVPDDLARKYLSCPKCGQVVTAPASASMPLPVPPTYPAPPPTPLDLRPGRIDPIGPARPPPGPSSVCSGVPAPSSVDLRADANASALPVDLRNHLQELEEWAAANKRDAFRDTLAFWGLKIPAILAAASAGVWAHFDLTA